MSTQSSLPVKPTKSLESSNGSPSTSFRANRRVSLSNTQLTRAADEAFWHDRQDKGLEANRNEVPSNPLNGKCPTESYHMNLRKRKCDIDSYGNTTATINTDFLSGIFQDLAAATTTNRHDGYVCGVPNPLQNQDFSHSHLVSCASEDIPRPLKKAKTVNSFSSVSSFQQRSKSFANSLLLAGQTAKCEDFSTDQHDPSYQASTPRDDSAPTDTYHRDQIDPSNTSNHCDSNSTAAEIVDQVFGDNITNIQFPTLPATVSASSCSSNNLTQTSVPAAAQVPETPKTTASSCLINIGGGEQKDSYGWFVDMDEDHVHDRFAEVAAASQSCKARLSTDDGDTLPGLTFSAKVSETKKEVELDSEVIWAKAADTVDDVLGEALFF